MTVVHESPVDVSHYTYRVTWSAEDEEFVATCVEMPSLSWLDSSPERALTRLQDLVGDVLADMQESGEKIPEPLSTRSYSGRFNLRVGESLHRRLAMEAAEQGVSLNQLILGLLQARVGTR